MDREEGAEFYCLEQCCIEGQIDLEDPRAPAKEEEMHASALEQDIRAALMEHWAASDANEFSAEHQIYCDDAILDYPQSGERIRGRANIQASRALQPSKKRFEVRRILGSGGLWITEYIIYYDEKPFFTVSIMEFRDGKVAHETQYFGEPFAASSWRSRFVEQIGPASTPTEKISDAAITEPEPPQI